MEGLLGSAYMKANLYLALSAVLWGLNFHLLRIMLNSSGYLEAGFWRYLFGVLFLLLFTSKSLPGLGLIKRNLKGIFLTAIAGIFLFNVLLFRGMEYTSAINASLIMSLNPLMTLFLSSVIFNSSIKSSQIGGAILSFLGVVFLLSQGNVSQLHRIKLNPGDGLILLATVLAAFYHIWVKKYSGNLKNEHFTFLTNLVCLLCFTLLLPFIPKTHPLDFGVSFWIAALSFGGLGTAVTYSLWNKGVELAGPQKAGLFMNLVPLSTAGIAILTGETIDVYHIISGGFILTGLCLSQINRKNMRLLYHQLKR